MQLIDDTGHSRASELVGLDLVGDQGCLAPRYFQGRKEGADDYGGGEHRDEQLHHGEAAIVADAGGTDFEVLLSMWLRCFWFVFFQTELLVPSVRLCCPAWGRFR